MTGYFRFVLGHRVAVIIAVALITILSAISFSTGIIATSVRKMFFGDAPEYAFYLEKIRRFANDEAFVVAYEDPAPLSRVSLDRLSRVIETIEALSDVARTESLLDAQRIWSDQNTLRVDTYARLARRPGVNQERLMQQLMADELYRGLLVSTDGKHASVIVELRIDPDREAERAPRLVTRVLDLFAKAGYQAHKLHRAGIPAVLGEIISQTHHNLQRLFPITIVVLLVVSFLVFRRLAPALMAMTVSGLSVAWTMGFARLLDREFSIFMSVVPQVILIVAFSDVIHLWSAFLLEREGGKDKGEAILASASDVGTACLLTSATTFVGFLSLSAVPTPMFRIVGLVLGFGVGVALLLAMTLLPVTLSLLRMPGPGRRRRVSLQRQQWLLRALRMLARVSTRRPLIVIGGFLLALAVSVVGLFRLNIETNLNERIDEDTTFRRDQAYFERHFAGNNMLEVFVDADKPQGLLDPGVFKRVAQFQDRLEQLSRVDRVVSLVTLLRTMHRVLGGEGRLPQTRQAIAQYLLLFEMSGGEDLERLVDFDRRSMRLAVRLNEYAVRASQEAGLAARQLGRKSMGPHGGAQVHVTSLSFLMGWWLDSIVEGERNGLLISFLVIAVMMMIGLRSVRVGLLSMVPNLLPLLALGGYLGYTVDNVDSDTLVIAILAIGIGVDDTIHFLMRYRIESGRTTDRALALQRTFDFSGRAIVITTVVLVAGFLPFASSNYYSATMIGTLLPGVLIVALLADLLMVPSMVQMGMLAYPPPRPEEADTRVGGQGDSVT